MPRRDDTRGIAFSIASVYNHIATMNHFIRNPNNKKKRKSPKDSSRWAFDELTSIYDLHECMGEGCFGKVHKVTRNRAGRGLFNIKKQNNTFACKTIPRSKVGDMRMLKEECSNLEDVRGHSHLLNFEQTFEDEKEVHIVSELLEGGELFATIIEMKKQRANFSEEDSAWMVRNILDGLSYCHDVIGIVHRDLKASNFMFKRKVDIPGKNRKKKINKARNSQNLRDIKIIDFGLSTKVDPKTGTVQGCMGTPYYVAPEVLTQEFYGSKCDVWSAGVIAYLILSKQLPYKGKDEEQTVQFLMDAENHPPKYDSMRWMTLDPQAVAFCKSLLQVDPTKRPTAREAMSHPWIVKHCGLPPPQRSRINLEHSITVAPTEDTEDGTLLKPSPTGSFDKSTPLSSITELPQERKLKKKMLQRLFCPIRDDQPETEIIEFTSVMRGKSPRRRQETPDTLIMQE
jgi:serine/threonine protein kinase